MARRSRMVSEERERKGRVWKIAAYIRLSREEEREGESESITNQRAMIRAYLAEIRDGDEYVLVREYVEMKIA